VREPPSNRVLIGYEAIPTTGMPPDLFRLYVNSIPSCSTCVNGTSSAFFSGDIYSSGSWTASDSILKNNVQTLNTTNAINIVKQLEPKTYSFDQQSFPQLGLPSGLQYGLIAEDVESILPSLVREITTPPTYDSTGAIKYEELTFKSMKYEGLIPILIGSIKDQQHAIDSLGQQLRDLQKQVHAMIIGLASS
jgi:hypothetical protein